MWIWGVLAELEAAGLITLADKGYQGSTYAKIPYRGKNKPESQKQANKAHARLRSPGERANAQLKTQCRLAYFDHAAVLMFVLFRAGLRSLMVAGASWRVPCWPGFLTR